MVFVLNKNKQPLNPCKPAKARKLLKRGKAVVHKMFPFTIRLKYLVDAANNKQEYRIKVDPGSKTTGLAISKENEVYFLAELHHKTDIRNKLESRSNYRGNRRNRNLRYRPVRWANRKRKEGWIPPSLQARVDNIASWVRRLKKLVPLTHVSQELVKFDLQKMQNPEITGVEYQQGTLQGYEVREYLLEKFGRKCAYCEVVNVPLEVEHVHPKSRDGSNRISNLTLACRECNEEKDNLLLEDWIVILKKKKTKRNQTILKNIPIIQTKLKKSLKDAAVVNVTRWKLFNSLKETNLNVETGTGARTKMQRILHNLDKQHYYDALCVGESTTMRSFHFETEKVNIIKAKGRGTRYRSRTDKNGFPIHNKEGKLATFPKTKLLFGFQSGDMVTANVPKGKYKGQHVGSIAMRSSGSVDIKNTKGKRVAQGINVQYCSLLQRNDGYSYSLQAR